MANGTEEGDGFSWMAMTRTQVVAEQGHEAWGKVTTWTQVVAEEEVGSELWRKATTWTLAVAAEGGEM